MMLLSRPANHPKVAHQYEDIHRNSSGKSILSIAKLTPNYTFEFGDLQNFENKLSATSREFNQDIEVNYVTKQNIWGDILISMLPFILIIAIWIFIMRRMSSGTGGAGGAISVAAGTGDTNAGGAVSVTAGTSSARATTRWRR